MQNDKRFFVYILTNKRNTVLYIGVTFNLRKRVYEHKEKIVQGFSTRYNLDKLVYYEVYGRIIDAISREKKLKKWNRKWKEDLIEKDNAGWRDLYDEFCGN